MHKLWLVARHEYRKIVRRRAFVLATIGVPIFFVVIMAASILTALGGNDPRPIGYVDQAGVLAARVMLPASGSDKPIEMRAFADESAARAGLEAGTLQGYYVIPPDYLKSREVQLYYWKDSPSDTAKKDFRDFLRANLVADLPQDIQTRLIDGFDVTVRSADGSREANSTDGSSFLLPFAVGLLFMFATFSSGGYLLQAVTTEKENRTIEVLVTSLTPEQLIGGKVAGLIGVALTQLLIWGGAIAVMLAVGGQYSETIRSIKVPGEFVVILLLFFFPAYLLLGGMMAMIGGAVTETRQGQQVSGILTLLFTAPYFLVALFLVNPDTPALVVLTLFPTTSFITITIRWALTQIPAWQLIVSWVLLVASAFLSVWAAARIFRTGMLRYGQRLDLRAMLGAVRTRAQ